MCNLFIKYIGCFLQDIYFIIVIIIIIIIIITKCCSSFSSWKYFGNFQILFLIEFPSPLSYFSHRPTPQAVVKGRVKKIYLKRKCASSMKNRCDIKDTDMILLILYFNLFTSFVVYCVICLLLFVLLLLFMLMLLLLLLLLMCRQDISWSLSLKDLHSTHDVCSSVAASKGITPSIVIVIPKCFVNCEL